MLFDVISQKYPKNRQLIIYKISFISIFSCTHECCAHVTESLLHQWNFWSVKPQESYWTRTTVWESFDHSWLSLYVKYSSENDMITWWINAVFDLVLGSDGPFLTFLNNENIYLHVPWLLTCNKMSDSHCCLF